jgi:hypothetical protein
VWRNVATDRVAQIAIWYEPIKVFGTRERETESPEGVCAYAWRVSRVDLGIVTDLEDAPEANPLIPDALSRALAAPRKLTDRREIPLEEGAPLIRNVQCAELPFVGNDAAVDLAGCAVGSVRVMAVLDKFDQKPISVFVRGVRGDGAETGVDLRFPSGTTEGFEFVSKSAFYDLRKRHIRANAVRGGRIRTISCCRSASWV